MTYKVPSDSSCSGVVDYHDWRWEKVERRVGVLHPSAKLYVVTRVMVSQTLDAIWDVSDWDHYGWLAPAFLPTIEYLVKNLSKIILEYFVILISNLINSLAKAISFYFMMISSIFKLIILRNHRSYFSTDVKALKWFS